MVEPTGRDASSGPKRTVTFSELTKEVARRNEEAQKVARVSRTAREKEQMALRRRWERL